MKEVLENKKNDKRKLSKIRRNNAKLYPVYKMFSWDLLFYYSVEFLFYTIAKGATASEVLIVYGIYLLFRIMGQIPAVMVNDLLGKRKSIIIGNILVAINMVVMIFVPGAFGILLADFIFAIGYDIKKISETNLLYDSVATKGGEGLYSKLDTKGGSWYYILDGIASLTAGYLFVINNYLPMVICLIFTIIATILSFRFKDVYEVKKSKKGSFRKIIKEYRKDLKKSSKFILKSKRIKALILFKIVFYSIISITMNYRSQLLVDLKIPEEQFSMIFACLILVGGIALSYKEPIEKKFKNKTLSFISLMYVGAIIVIGIVSSIYLDEKITPIIIIMYAIMKMSTSIWYILEYKYLKNFSTEKMRNKITFTYELIGGVFGSIFSILGGLLLNVASVEKAFLIIGLIAFLSLVATLRYMKTRIGLKPHEYKKEDISF